MREIKCRVWDKGTESYVESGFDFRIDGNGNIYRRGWGETVWDKTQNLIIEQFTGLKDKNGTEIYEGDIVKIKSAKQAMAVVYQPPNFVMIMKTKSGKWSKSWSEFIFHSKDNQLQEIIGDIHQNPEFMEQSNG